MESYLPDKTDELFEHLLPKYRENRKRWPLWTYNREPDPATEKQFKELLREGSIQRWVTTWTPCEAWADRLQWSPPAHMLPLRSRAWIYLRKAGFTVYDWSPGDTWAVVEKIEDLDDDQGRYPAENERSKRVRIPYLFALESAAVIHQLAPQIPDRPRTVGIADEIPDHDQNAGLDRYDYRELARTLIRTLVSTDVRLPDHPLLDRAPDNDNPSKDLGTFLGRMVFQHTGPGGHLKEERETLSRAYCGSVGLLPSRQGAGNVLVHDYRFLQLWNETESLVDFVRGWTPDDDLLRSVRRLLKHDPHLAHREVELLAQWGRAGQTTPHVAANHPLAIPVIRLRFPFLQAFEIREILKREEVGGAWTLSRKQPQRRVLAMRFPNWRPGPGDDAVREYLSRVRKRTDLEL